MLPLAFAVSPTLCVLGLVQILAVAAAGAARIAEGTPHERWGQWLCLGGLAVVGTLCGAAIRIGPNAAAACAVTLAIVTMISVADFSPRR
jgi:hypothetical protein